MGFKEPPNPYDSEKATVNLRHTEVPYLTGQVEQKGSSRAPTTAPGLVLEYAFSQESQVVLGAVVPSSAMQSKAKFTASTCLKSSVNSSFFQDQSSAQCFPRLSFFQLW